MEDLARGPDGTDLTDWRFSVSVAALRVPGRGLEAEAGRSVQLLLHNASRTQSPTVGSRSGEHRRCRERKRPRQRPHSQFIRLGTPQHRRGDRPSSRIIDLNSGSGTQATPAYAAYSASTTALFRKADSVVRFGHDKSLHIFEMAPGVVETEMTKSMPVHDFRGEGDWTSPEQVTDLAVALASGTLDTFTGRYVRAGAESEDSLVTKMIGGIETFTRRIALG
ncbi:SDR family NAD(P)-dependent oxidoreductase [Brevibacterium aurantiacum]|uniref:SDR family NAD(P)-dependent oxidoreductase n=1 Tax=Brevibacterium aurantiacum TaxID=273384 RepID=UPI00299F8A14|nr:SDR family NAD(P)-dependent oxidoreductase [Brevibacterium aurantiacum]